MKARLCTVIVIITLSFFFIFFGCHKPTDPDDPIDLEITDETVVIDPDQTTIIQVTPSQVIITGTANYQSGDVIVSDASSAAPFGLLRNVQSVTVQGNQTVLNTIPATLEDVFNNADVLVSQALNTKDIKESRVLTNGVFFIPDAKNDEKFSYDINKHITLPTGQVMTISGSLGVENSFDFDLKIRNKNISFCKYTHIAEQSSELSVSVNNSYDYSRDFDLYEHTFFPFTVWIGPVPIVFVPKIKVVLNVSASGEAGVSTSISQTASVSAGIQLQDGQWSTFSDEDISFDFQPPQLTNELSISVGAGPDLSLMLFGIAGPYANTRGSIVLTADLFNTPWWTLTGKVKIDGGIRFDALGVEADYSSNFLNYSHVIAQATQNQCATPLFNPPAGSYSNTQSVSISCATPSATIMYTTDGSDPNSSSPVYSNPINVYQNTTLKARASKNGWTDSSVSTAGYTISPTQTVATPTFSPPGGSYSTAQSVTISCTTSGATIFYSTDGSTPSIQYTGPVNIATTTTLKAKATKSGWIDSATATVDYTISTPMQMIYVSGGSYTMGRTTGSGDSDELPTHSVTLNSFYIGKYEVTQSEWQAIWGSNPAWETHGLGPNYPVYFVTWYAILKYCNLRSISEGFMPCYTISGSTNPADWGNVPSYYNTAWDNAICDWNANGYRLPTEAEWEYAARGATNDPDYLYSGSNDLNAVAWNYNNSSGHTHIVGTKLPNGLGIYDMSGNVNEWCWDWYSSSYYTISPSNNPHGPNGGSYRVQRGSDFGYNAIAYDCRVASRHRQYPYVVGPTQNSAASGFRLCRSAP